MKLLLALVSLATAIRAEPASYRPAPGSHRIGVIAKMSLRDELRQRDVVFKITFPMPTGSPRAKGSAPVILWSHGMYGSKDNYQPLAAFWAAHGYVVIQPTHADSLKNGMQSRIKAFRAWTSRPGDVSFLIESLGTIGKKLPVKPDKERIGMGGHSFGAHTTMLVGGTKTYRLFRKAKTYTDKRPKCLLLVSPQGVGGLLREDSWSDMKRPALLITGSKDGDPFGDKKKTPQWRLAAYERSTPGNKYLAFIDGATHDFGGIAGSRRFGKKREKNEDFVNVVRYAGLALFDAYVKGDPRAKKWLDEGRVATATKAKVTAKKR